MLLLLLEKFNYIGVIKNYGMTLKWGGGGGGFILYLFYLCSYRLITQNERFIVRANICQRKSEFYTHISILLKLSLVHVHLKSNAKVI